jgi:hypothetical protein
MAQVYVNRQPDYRDLDLSFIKHPTTSDVVIKEGEEAIKRSVRNLIFTNFYDRPFRSYIGSNVKKILFDNFSAFSADNLRDAITEVITKFEPRVRLMTVEVEADIDRNGFNVRLYYVILNREQPIITSIFLQRIR